MTVGSVSNDGGGCVERRWGRVERRWGLSNDGGVSNDGGTCRMTVWGLNGGG